MIVPMTPALIALLLLAMLLALIPVRRLNTAGWSAGSLFTAWLLYALATFAAVRLGGPLRYLLPVLVIAYVAPFVARPERLARLLGPRREPPRPVIDVTPRAAQGLPDPEPAPPPRRTRGRKPPEEIR
jgi:hypothetical protein